MKGASKAEFLLPRALARLRMTGASPRVTIQYALMHDVCETILNGLEASHP